MKDEYVVMSDDEPIAKDIPKFTKEQEREMDELIRKAIEKSK